MECNAGGEFIDLHSSFDCMLFILSGATEDGLCVK